MHRVLSKGLSSATHCPALCPWSLNLVIHANKGSFQSLNIAGGGRTWASQALSANSRETSSVSLQSLLCSSGLWCFGFRFFFCSQNLFSWEARAQTKTKQNKKFLWEYSLASQFLSGVYTSGLFVYYFLNSSDSPSLHGREMCCRKTEGWFLFLGRTKCDIGLLTG